MKHTLLIALLALAGFASLPAKAEVTGSIDSVTLATPENLSTPGKPCAKPGMGMGAGMGMGGGMGPASGMPPGMQGMMMGEGRACPKSACGCKMHADMSRRVEQLEKRVDALQMALEILTRQGK